MSEYGRKTDCRKAQNSGRGVIRDHKGTSEGGEWVPVALALEIEVEFVLLAQHIQI